MRLDLTILEVKEFFGCDELRLSGIYIFELNEKIVEPNDLLFQAG